MQSSCFRSVEWSTLSLGFTWQSQVLDDITESIFMSSEACPRTLRYICACLQRDVQNRCKRVLIFSWSISFRWPQERFVKTRVVSGFIFLRLLCPAILNPRQVFYLVVPSKAWCSTTVTFFAVWTSLWAGTSSSHALARDDRQMPPGKFSGNFQKTTSLNLFRIWPIWWSLEERNLTWRCD